MNKAHAHKSWFLVLILSFALGMIGCKETSSEGKTKTEGQTKTDEGTSLLQPGQSATSSNLEVTLLSLKKTSEYINGPKTGQGYAVLRFRVKNIGKEEESARIYSDLQWNDPVSGMRNGYERTTGVKLNNPKKYDLEPGAQGEFEEVYMFPNNLSEVEFHLLKGYNPKEVARWMMPIK
ncbi:MAG: DUF5067 domain-containing protein [Proteobacteria bacterium]|nr:DUF5067 domain-containing protein [Pseudomonadota bacterium]